MAIDAQNFMALANFYNQLMTVMTAICVRKGGIAAENYVGRFVAADVLEMIVEYGEKSKVPADVLDKFRAEYEKVKDLTTPTKKPIHEMTLEEFEKVMNI